MELYLYILMVVVGAVFVGAAVLYLIKKLFKLENPTYKKSLILTVIPGAIAAILGGLAILVQPALVGLVGGLASAIGFIYLLRKQYDLGFVKAIGLTIVNGIVSGIVVGLLFITPFRAKVMEPFVVAGSSMEPNYHYGDYLFIKKYNLDIQRGDVVVYQSPNGFYIHRVVGLPGEKVEINQSGKVMVNGAVLNESYAQGITTGEASLSLSSDQYYVLGDNRIASADSRIIGPVKKSDIKGEVFKNFGTLLK